MIQLIRPGEELKEDVCVLMRSSGLSVICLCPISLLAAGVRIPRHLVWAALYLSHR